MEKIVKTPQQVALQIERWFFLYYRMEKSAFSGNDPFTIFDLLSVEKQNEIKSKIDLHTSEIPVLILSAPDNGYIINTTMRFINVSASSCESIYYADFHGHRGYTSIGTDSKHNIKTNGTFQEFGLLKKNGELINWEIATGRAGFGFWNITKKFEIIGRRYLITN